jgi:hypothetical protein
VIKNTLGGDTLWVSVLVNFRPHYIHLWFSVYTVHYVRYLIGACVRKSNFQNCQLRFVLEVLSLISLLWTLTQTHWLTQSWLPCPVDPCYIASGRTTKKMPLQCFLIIVCSLCHCLATDDTPITSWTCVPAATQQHLFSCVHPQPLSQCLHKQITIFQTTNCYSYVK